MAEEATPEAKLNIATYFIMNSPTGEVIDVLSDVNKLLNDPATFNEAAVKKILRGYNIDQLVSATDPDGNPVLVSAFNEVDSEHYYEPNTGRILKYDHKKQKFTEASEKKVSQTQEITKLRSATQKQLNTYLDNNYKNGKVVGAVFIGDAGSKDAGKMHLCISAKNVNLANFWTGGWRSVMSVAVGNPGQTELKANIKVNVHYFEDGNVQLHTTLEKTANVNISADVEATASEITKAANKIETEFQAQLEEMYVNMHHKTFKSMRRFYPMTREPMRWNISAHSLASEVSKN